MPTTPNDKSQKDVVNAAGKKVVSTQSQINLDKLKLKYRDGRIASPEETRLFVKKLNEMSSSYGGATPEDFIKIFVKENGLTSDGSILLDQKSKADTNTSGGKAMGLIQFVPSTAKSLKLDQKKLSTMTPVEQLGYVDKYFKSIGDTSKIKGYNDLYLSVFYPAAVGKGDDYVIAKKGQKAYKSNSPIDIKYGNKDGVITKGDFNRYASSVLPPSVKELFNDVTPDDYKKNYERISSEVKQPSIINQQETKPGSGILKEGGVLSAGLDGEPIAETKPNTAADTLKTQMAENGGSLIDSTKAKPAPVVTPVAVADSVPPVVAPAVAPVAPAVPVEPVAPVNKTAPIKSLGSQYYDKGEKKWIQEIFSDGKLSLKVKSDKENVYSRIGDGFYSLPKDANGKIVARRYDANFENPKPVKLNNPNDIYKNEALEIISGKKEGELLTDREKINLHNLEFQAEQIFNRTESNTKATKEEKELAKQSFDDFDKIYNGVILAKDRVNHNNKYESLKKQQLDEAFAATLNPNATAEELQKATEIYQAKGKDHENVLKRVTAENETLTKSAQFYINEKKWRKDFATGAKFYSDSELDELYKKQKAQGVSNDGKGTGNTGWFGDWGKKIGLPGTPTSPNVNLKRATPEEAGAVDMNEVRKILTENPGVIVKPIVPIKKPTAKVEEKKAEEVKAPTIKDVDPDNFVTPDFIKSDPELAAKKDPELIARQNKADQDVIDFIKSQKPTDQTLPEEKYDGSNLIGNIGDIGKMAIGLQGARKPVEEYEMSPMMRQSLTDAESRKNYGLDSQTKGYMQQQAERAYGYDIANIRGMSGGSAGVGLANLGRAAETLQTGFNQIGVQDQMAKVNNRNIFNNAAGIAEGINRQQFQDKLAQTMATKQEGAALARDAYTNLNERAQFEAQYGKGSQYQQYMNEQILSQRTNRNLLESGNKTRNLQAISELEKNIYERSNS